MSNNKVTNRVFTFDYFRDRSGEVSGHTDLTSVASYQDLFSGVDNPHWRDEITAGNNAGTDAFGQYSTYNNPFASLSARVHHLSNPTIFFLEEFSGHFPVAPLNAPDPGTSVKTDCRNRAISKFLSACDSARSSVELGQDLGELKQTIEAMISPLRSLRELTLGYLSGLRRLKGRNLKRPAMHKALADSYLEYRFGWRPLALDIADAYSGLSNNDHMSVIPVQAGASVDYSGSQFYQALPGSGTICSPTFSIQDKYKYSLRYKGAVRTGADKAGHISAAQLLQIDLPHFVPTVWDLIPYSFVVDYFTNVGDVIKSYTFLTSAITWAVKTERTTAIRTRTYFKNTSTFTNPDYTYDYRDGGFAGPASVETVVWNRHPIDPSTGLRVYPAFTMPLSSRPWENIGALILSRIKSLVPLTH